MLWKSIDKKRHEREDEIPHCFGETIFRDYFQYAKAHPIVQWDVPTEILYAGTVQGTEKEGGKRHMICEICRDEKFLAQKAEPATADDLGTAANLLETLIAHKDGCVGMAANMIGVNRRIIAFDDEGKYTVLFNPEIIRKSEPYEAEEGCLSLTGTRKTKRWRSVKVQYQNEKFQTRLKTFTGFTAQIIQHETDHCDGILI